MSRSFKKRLKTRPVSVMALGAALAILPTMAHAQTAADPYRNPQQQMIDLLGMSIDEDIYVRNDTLLTIGNPGAGGLAWAYHGHYSDLSGDFRGEVVYDPDTTQTFVSTGDDQAVFLPGASGTFVNASGNSATLVLVSGQYVYSAINGTVYTYSGGQLSTVLKPNGVLITGASQTIGDCTTPSSSACTAMDGSVVTNTGYAFRFNYKTNVISAVNMLVAGRNCGTQAFTCTAYDNYITMSGFTDSDFVGTGNRTQFTDSLGNNWRYLRKFSYVYRNPHDFEDVERGPPVLFTFKDPTGYLVKLTRDSQGQVTSFADQRGTFPWVGGNSTDPAGAALFTHGGTVTGSGNGAQQQAWVKDGLNRQTTYNYTQYVTATLPLNGYPLGVYKRLNSVVQPEGNSLTYSYDGRGNITQTVSTPKPGSGLSAVTVYQAGYDTVCSNLKTCNQPNWTKDAKGSQTDYTYSATHGGILTVTGPVDQNALRSRTYNTYETYNTGNGNIYRLVRSEICGLSASQLSLSACPAVATTMVLTSTYLGSTFQPVNVTQTDGAGTLSATATYAYDNIGNVISVDGPVSGTVDQSFKTYDANRRVICEIGVDPDGAGALPRAMTRHTYDGAGRELKTEIGTGTSTSSCLSTNMTVTSFSRMTYDAVGRLIKTEAVQP